VDAIDLSLHNCPDKSVQMRVSSIHRRSQFFKGVFFGVIIVIVKLVVFLPIDIADAIYGATILVTLIITAGDLFGSKFFAPGSNVLDFIIGFLFPLDCYAVLILFGVPLVN
jgi:hypothetical protein